MCVCLYASLCVCVYVRWIKGKTSSYDTPDLLFSQSSQFNSTKAEQHRILLSQLNKLQVLPLLKDRKDGLASVLTSVQPIGTLPS